MTAVLSFDTALDPAHLWLQATVQRLPIDDPQVAFEALRAVTIALRDALPPDAVAALSVRGPMLIRGLLLEGWKTGCLLKPVRETSAFTDVVSSQLPDDCPINGRQTAVAVFGMLCDQLEKSQICQIADLLPKATQSL